MSSFLLCSPRPPRRQYRLDGQSFTDFLLSYVGALAAVGALSMAVIEAGQEASGPRALASRRCDGRSGLHGARSTRAPFLP